MNQLDPDKAKIPEIRENIIWVEKRDIENKNFEKYNSINGEYEVQMHG